MNGPSVGRAGYPFEDPEGSETSLDGLIDKEEDSQDQGEGKLFLVRYLM